MKERILVTGGAGFMGSHMIDYLLCHYPDCTVVCIDKLSYACYHLMGNLEKARNHPNFKFLNLDLASDYCELKEFIMGTAAEEPITTVLNFAAETSVDLSFENPRYYTQNNIMATQNMLECCRTLLWKLLLVPKFVFIHISTDEVYGEQQDSQFVNEDARLLPSNPYSATKAACDLIVHSYVRSFKMPVILIRPNNVYGPRQYPEKIAAVTLAALKHAKFGEELADEHKIPIHGNGQNTRRYLHVFDFVRAVDLVLKKARNAALLNSESLSGEIFNVGTEDEIKNLDFVKLICDAYMKDKFGATADIRRLIKFTKDRDFNDARYATNYSKIAELGWKQQVSLKSGVRELVADVQP